MVGATKKGTMTHFWGLNSQYKETFHFYWYVFSTRAEISYFLFMCAYDARIALNNV